MNLTYVIILLILIIVLVSSNNIYEHMIDNEAVIDIASVYNNEKMIVSNVNVTQNLTANNMTTGHAKIMNGLDVDGDVSFLPRGVIVTWTGAIAPKGWALCDGTNGTPDLRGRFIRMYSDTMSGFNDKTWNVLLPETQNKINYPDDLVGRSRNEKKTNMFKHKLGDRGGTDSNILTIDEMPQHSHFAEGRGYAHCPEQKYKVRSINIDCFESKNDSDTNAGSNWEHNNQPPYYVLAFIMKL